MERKKIVEKDEIEVFF